jgi:hypothetical protein
LSWFNTKPVEELYDDETDPYELNNLAANPEYNKKLTELKNAFENWNRTVGDMSQIPEKEMISAMWEGKNEPPVTAIPQIIKSDEGVKITCATTGASIGYRVIRKGETCKTVMHPVMSYDFGILMNPSLKGKELPVPSAWEVYQEGHLIKLNPGDSLKVAAMRIGFQAATLNYVY